MHTARQLDRSHFAIRVAGKDADRDAVLPDWGRLDRLGVVITEPFGAVGASHLIQLVITAFYDAVPSRRDGDPGDLENRLAVYPEIYLFHLGGRQGDHSSFDFWPGRKEVFLGDAGPRQVLDAINDRAITRLAVPERTPQPFAHEFKEPNAARERIVGCFAYSPSGKVESPDFEIEGLDPATEENPASILDPVGHCEYAEGDPFFNSSDDELRERCWGRRTVDRCDEATPGLEPARERRRAIRKDGLATENYAFVEVDEALQMLYRPI
jgi:hypothetical protein